MCLNGGAERKRTARTGSECLHSYISKLLATHHYKYYNSTSTKQDLDHIPGPVLLARNSLACHYLHLRKSNSPARPADSFDRQILDSGGVDFRDVAI